MLFRPHSSKYIFGWHVPFTSGIIPKEKERIAESIGNVVSDNLMNKDVLKRYLLSDEMVENIRATFTRIMKVFKVTPKRIKRTNGTVLTPDMTVIVTMQMHSTTPFSNGAKEVAEAYMRIYGYDYKKACCNAGDFEFQAIG